MIPERFKIRSIRSNEWTCFFCLHVRTATILLGIWHLILHVLALAVLALLMRNSVVQQKRQEEIEQSNFLPTPLSKIKDDDNPYYLPTTQDGRTIYSSDIDMGALMTVCTLSITLLMVYGAIRGKAAHLLPFFCLQLFDFAITTLTATGYFCYLRSVHRLVAEHWHNLPLRNELLKLSPHYLSLIVLGAFLVSMLWKAYCIGIVWRCYRYLTMRQQSIRNSIHYILPGGGENSDRGGLPEPDYSTLLRDQEAAFGSFMMKQTPPPSYQDIMEDQPPPYPASDVGASASAVPIATPITSGVMLTAATTIPNNNGATTIENNSPRRLTVLVQNDATSSQNIVVQDQQIAAGNIAQENCAAGAEASCCNNNGHPTSDVANIEGKNPISDVTLNFTAACSEPITIVTDDAGSLTTTVITISTATTATTPDKNVDENSQQDGDEKKNNRSAAENIEKVDGDNK